ncbi:peptidylprolyl isomerase [Faecalitalea cylindroides]|uniref:peptidylprolyl isomerase n=1 Tax=Faecalitalea cylindroides TaxID=39483 RepID=UPI00194FAE3F|nr:peptidylprolyl isomerase [Faecalitalea cylindroides]
MKTELILITMENGDEIKAELYPEAAPKTVENFLKLVDEKFYDGLIFHRVIKGFMIQGGDPTGTGMGGSKDTIVGEFRANGFQNDLAHTRGVLSMARTNMPNSASSQFFIMHQDAPHLDGQYAAFGKVIEGMEAVDKIASVKTNWQDKPLKDQRIKTIRRA